jgi:hypothetical protein
MSIYIYTSTFISCKRLLASRVCNQEQLYEFMIPPIYVPLIGIQLIILRFLSLNLAYSHSPDITSCIM